MPEPTEPLVTEAGETRRPAPPLQHDFPGQRVVETSRGLRVPRIGLGTFRLDATEAERVVEEALAIGYRHIDTAQMYGNEGGVGRALTAAGVDRGDLFVTTKIANDKHEPNDLVRSVEQSLRNLQTDYVDLLLIHWPVEWRRVSATMAALAQVHAGGLAARIGVSNFTLGQLDEVVDMAPIEVLQVECHPLFQQRELRAWCRDHDWIFTAYPPLAQGALLDEATLVDIGGAHDVGPTSVSLAWLASRQGVAAIPRTADRAHLVDNWQAQFVDLTADEVERIDGLDSGRRVVDPDFAPW